MDDELYECSCCGNKIINELGCYEICDICNWEDDPIQCKYPDYNGGANDKSLSEFRKEYFNNLRL